MLRPPGPKPHFLIGNIPLAGRAPLATFRSWAAEYGDIFYYRVIWLHVYFLNRPDLTEYVLVRNPQCSTLTNRWPVGACMQCICLGAPSSALELPKTGR